MLHKMRNATYYTSGHAWKTCKGAEAIASWSIASSWESHEKCNRAAARFWWGSKEIGERFKMTDEIRQGAKEFGAILVELGSCCV